MIREVHIEGFKSIVDQTLELGRVNCFIGANGDGKSNVLEAIGILSAAAAGRIDDEALARRGVRGGLPRLFKTSFASGRIPPHITLSARSELDAKYLVSLLNPLDKPEPEWAFKTESLTSRREAEPVVTRGVRSLNLSPSAGLAALKLVELAEDHDAAMLLTALQSYAIYCPNTPTMRANDPQTRRPVGLTGGSLDEGFEALRERVSEETLDEVLELIDWAHAVHATDASGETSRNKRELRFTDRFMASGRNTLTASDASEGALYILFAAVLCLSPASPRIFAIDNLDQALNPKLVSRLSARLAGWLLKADPERQLLFTAHNPAVLDGLDLDDPETRLFAVKRNSEGHTTLRRIEVTEELKAWHTTHPLSRLWMMGRLGALPDV